MKTIVTAPMAVLVLLSACTSSDINTDRLNPINWFERNTESERTEAVAPAVPQNSQELLPVISSLQAQPFGGGGGIILIAAGVPPTFGYFDAVLLPANDGEPINGELVFEFRATAPVGEVDTGTDESREITVAVTLTERQLQGVDTIRVIAAANEQAITI